MTTNNQDNQVVDPGALPNASDAGSAGQEMGAGKAGAGTGMSIGPSRGNTGPGTGSDALEAQYGGTPPTTLGQMAGTSDDTDQGGNGPLTEEPNLQRAARTGEVAPAADAPHPGNPPGRPNAGLGDNDIPAETEQR
jgi:hypothetical protein